MSMKISTGQGGRLVFTRKVRPNSPAAVRGPRPALLEADLGLRAHATCHF